MGARFELARRSPVHTLSRRLAIGEKSGMLQYFIGQTARPAVIAVIPCRISPELLATYLDP
jgi:hypothetical protein